MPVFYQQTVWPTLYHVLGLSCYLPCTFSLGRDKPQRNMTNTSNTQKMFVNSNSVAATDELSHSCAQGDGSSVFLQWTGSWFPPQKPVWLLLGTNHCEEQMHKSRQPDDSASRMKQSPRWPQCLQKPKPACFLNWDIPPVKPTTALCGHLCPCCRWLGSQTGSV